MAGPMTPAAPAATPAPVTPATSASRPHQPSYMVTPAAAVTSVVVATPTILPGEDALPRGSTPIASTTLAAPMVIAEHLSEEEIGGLKELLKIIVTDNSGMITFDELKDGPTILGSELMEHEIQRHLWMRADIDNCSTSDYGEFLAATVHMNKLERDENLVTAFSFFSKKMESATYPSTSFCKMGKLIIAEFAAMMRKGIRGIGRRTMRDNRNVNSGDALRSSEHKKNEI